MSQLKNESNKVEYLVSFQMSGSYPHIGGIDISFPASNRFNNVIVSEWFGGRVCVQQVEKNIQLYLLIAMDKKERMTFLEVLTVLEQKGLALNRGALVDLQNAYRAFERAYKNTATKTTTTQIIHKFFKGLDKLFPENTHLLKEIPLTEEDMKKAVPVEEMYLSLGSESENNDLNKNGKKTMKVVKQETNEQELRKKIIKSVTDRIGEEAYFKLTNNTKPDIYTRQINAWIDNRLAQLKAENPQAVDAALEKNNDSSVQYLLLVLAEIAIAYHKNNKNPEDYKLLLLLEINKNYQFVEKNNVQLLCEAIKTKNLWCLYQVLNFGIDVNAPLQRKVDSSSQAHKTDIFKAYYYKRLDLVHAKLNAGGDPNETNDKGETLLQLAKQDKNKECINLLFSYYPPLFLAYELHESSMIKMLLSAGADKDQIGPEGLTLLGLAARDGRNDISQLISELSNEEKNRLENEKVKLQVLYDFTSKNCVDDLTKDNLNDLISDHHYYRIAINFWLSGIDTSSAEAFLDKLLNIARDLQDTKNYAYLFVALSKLKNNVTRDNLDKIFESKQSEVNALGQIMEKLFELFSDEDEFYTELSWNNVDFYTLTNSWLYDALPQQYSALELFNLLLKRSVMNGDLTAFRILIETHKKHNFIDLSDPHHLLNNSIKTHNTEFLSELIEIGFNVNKVDQAHSLPLSTAVSAGNLDVVKLLVEKGADPNLLVNKNLNFATMAVLHGYNQEIVDYIKPLINVETSFNKENDSEKHEQGKDDKKSESSSSSNSSSNSDSSSDTSSEEQEEATPVQKMVRKIFNNLAGNADPEAFIQNQWTAYGDSEVTHEDFTKTQDYIAAKIKDVKETRFEKFNYSDEATESEIASVKSVQARFQNVFMYAVKLYREHEECKDAKKKAVIEAKVNAVSDFINTIGDLSNLAENKEAIKKACNILEQHDANRGTGFYRVHSFFTNKRYQDEKGRSRLVKSTMGELAYDFYVAVKGLGEIVNKEVLNEEAKDDVLENSVMVGQ